MLKKNNWLEIEDVEFCSDCILDNKVCSVLGLIERGFLPGTKFMIKEELKGNIIVETDEGDKWAIEKKLLNQVKIKNKHNNKPSE